MNRNVITVQDARDLAARDDLGGHAAPAGTPTADDFWNRLLKLIPVEAIGAYLAATNLVLSVHGHNKREIVLWIIFVVVLVVTPFYLGRIGNVSRLRQVLVSVGAFIIWAFALGGPFKESWSGWEPWMGGVAVILYAFVLGAFPLGPLPQPQVQPAGS